MNPGGPAIRPFNSFSQAVDEIVEARIWAGLHFRTADVQAVQLGTNIANYAAANYFEPWATTDPQVAVRQARGGPPRWASFFAFEHCQRRRPANAPVRASRGLREH